jgi:two-component system chemotaxis response regulator CheY
MTTNKKELSVLVIEDNEMFRKLALDMLSGYVTYSASNAADGVGKFKANKPDITFVDIGLPDGSGHAVLGEIKAIDSNAFVVMLTASNLQKDVQDALKHGARGYIVKPFSRQKIKECIDQYHHMVAKLEKSKASK